MSGVDTIEHHHYNTKPSAHRHDHHKEFAMVYSDEIEDKIDGVKDRLEEKYPIEYKDIIDKNYEKEIINQKYGFIEEIIDEVLVNKDTKTADTDKIDRVLTHRIWGMPIFLGIMAIVFLLTFTVGDAIAGGFETLLDFFSNGVSYLVEAANASPVVQSLIVDGIIAGVGGILTFLPNIFILFLALGILEDSGYMSRVAYVMDGLMGKMGLSGRAFILMLLGFGCTVPAIMSARTLEDMHDRKRTIFIASIILWVVLNFGFNGMVDNMADSFAAYIGRWVSPVLAPAGLGYWQIVVALIAGIAAKEVVVSSCIILFGIANINSVTGTSALAAALGSMGFGPLNAFCLMVFCLLYIPCTATLATVKKETGSWKSMWLAAGFHLLIAWAVSASIFQIGSLFIL